jgi:uncharacterized protein with FMN-binding domain
MKKYIIGAAIALIFLIYSIALRSQHTRLILPSSSKAGSGNSSTGSNAVTASKPSKVKYKDGHFVGSVANAYYGNVQVAVDISNGKIKNVNFIQAPSDNPNSSYINQQAKPYLAQEAIQAQSSNVQVITGATFSSEAFIQSLTSALNKAK